MFRVNTKLYAWPRIRKGACIALSWCCVCKTGLNGRAYYKAALLKYKRSLGPSLCPERRPWACQPGLHDAGCLEKGCATCCGLGGRRGRGGGRGATDLRGSARIGGPSLARLWLGQGVQGPGTTCKTCMARPARATWCTHTAILSSQPSTAQTYHIHRPLSSLISKLHLKKPQDYSYIVMSTICVW